MPKHGLPFAGINEKRLRYFYHLMMLGSMRKTADLLNIEQSAISRQIQLLEAELQTQLFERRGRNVVPTEAAYVVLEYFEDNQKRELALFEQLAQLKSAQLAKVNLVSSESYLQDLMYDVLKHMHASHPNVQLQLELMSVHDVIRQITEGLAQIGLAYNPPLHPEIKVVAEKEEPFILAVPKGHPLTREKRAISLAETVSYKFAVMSVGHGFRQLLDSELIHLQIQLNVALTTNSITALKNYVIAGHGISAMRYADISSAVQAGQVDVLEIDARIFQQAKTQLLMRKGAHVSESQRVLMDRIRASFNLR
jgi:DNA-binding transcriptional LysR family regulator